MAERRGEGDESLGSGREERLRFALLEWIQLQTMTQGPMVDVQTAIWQLAAESRHVVRVVLWLETAGYVQYLGAGPTVCITEAGESALARCEGARRLA